MPGGASQKPWCYVKPGCKIESPLSTFKKPYAECVPAKPSKPTAAPAPGKESKGASGGFLARFFGRRLEAENPAATKPAAPAKGGHSSKKLTASSANTKRVYQSTPATRHAAKKDRRKAYSLELDLSSPALMSKMARFRPRYVALQHEETHTYVSVERPPHSKSLRAHAASPTLSLASIFALIRPPRTRDVASNTQFARPMAAIGGGKAPLARRSGANVTHSRQRRRSGLDNTLIVSLGVSAYLTLCPDHPKRDTGGSAGSATFEGAALCAGYRPEKKWSDPLKLLRKPSIPNAPAVFSTLPANM